MISFLFLIISYSLEYCPLTADYFLQNATSLPEPESSGVECKSASGGLYAVSSFTGLALEADVDREFMKLKKAMLVDNLVPGEDWILARYNDPFVNPAIRRNEILIPIEDGFSLW